MQERYRPDHDGTYRMSFERAKKTIYATQSVCGICGRPVDFSLKYPDPMAPCIDHIIPVSKGGHPSDLANLQLAHWSCNRQKSNKLMRKAKEDHEEESGIISNRILPQTKKWIDYRAEK